MLVEHVQLNEGYLLRCEDEIHSQKDRLSFKLPVVQVVVISYYSFIYDLRHEDRSSCHRAIVDQVEHELYKRHTSSTSFPVADTIIT